MIIFIGTLISLFLFSPFVQADDLIWEEIEIPINNTLEKYCIDPSGNYFGFAENNIIYKKLVQNDDWEKIILDQNIGEIENICLSSAGEVIIAGRYFIAISGNEGNTWILRTADRNYSSYLKNFYLNKDDVFYYLDQSDILIRSTDKGQTWERIHGSNVVGSRKVDFFMVTNHGDYIKSKAGDFGFYFSMDGFLNIDTLKGPIDPFFSSDYNIHDFEVLDNGSILIAFTYYDMYNELNAYIYALEDAQQWKPVAKAKLDTGVTKIYFTPQMYLQEGKHLIWNLIESFVIDSIFDDSFDIEIVNIWSRSVNELVNKPVIDISTEGINSTVFDNFYTISNNRIYLDIQDDFYLYDRNTDSFIDLPKVYDSSSIRSLGVTDDEGLLINKSQEEAFYKYNGTQWEKTNDYLIDRLGYVIYGCNKLFYSDGSEHRISFDYGKTYDTIPNPMNIVDSLNNSKSFHDIIFGTGEIWLRIVKENQIGDAIQQLTTDNGQTWKDIVSFSTFYKHDKYHSGGINLFGALSPDQRIYVSSHWDFDYHPMRVSFDLGETFVDCFEGIGYPDEESFQEMVFSPSGNLSLLMTNKRNIISGENISFYVSRDGLIWEEISCDFMGHPEFADIDDNGNILILDEFGRLFSTSVPVSVNNDIQKPKITIFPNPAETRLNLNFGSELSSYATLKLISLQGLTVYEEILLAGETFTTIDTSVLQTGMYILSLQTGGQTYTEKVIVK